MPSHSNKRRFEVMKSHIGPKAKLVKQSFCSGTFLANAVVVCGLILFYYTFSISLTFYNKKYIQLFKFPLSITMVHLMSKFVASVCVRKIISRCKGKPSVTLSWTDYIKRVAPPGIASSLDIALSNWSFEYITVSLYTMVKSTVILFIMFFSILFKLEKPRVSLILVVFLIASGVFLFSYETTKFNLFGFILVLTASFLSGIRWTLSQIVLQKSELGLSNPVDMMYHIQPWMILALLPLSSSIEGMRLSTSKYAFNYKDNELLLTDIAIIMSGAGLAFMLEMSEFLLVSRINSLTLSISGIFKEIITLLLDVAINHNSLDAIKSLGIFICILGITTHVILRTMYKESDELKVQKLDQSVSLLLRNGDVNMDGEDSDEEDIFNVERDR